MKSILTSSRSVGRLSCLSAAILGLATAVPASADVFVQELFDGIAGEPPGTDTQLGGLGSTSTTIGLDGTWVANAGNIMTASNFNSGVFLPGLPPDNGVLGGVWSGSDDYNTAIFATRPLSAAIDFSVDQVLYFSVHLRNLGDMAAGIGLAAGADPSSEFVGAGLSWNNATSIGGTPLDAGNSAYIGYGTLDQEAGAYGIRAFQGKDTTEGDALIVGRLTINSGMPDVLDIMRYLEGDVIDSDLSTIVWSASSSFNSDMLASSLLLWTNGKSGSGQVDGIRFGTTWFDVTGVESVPEPATLGYILIAGSAVAILAARRRRVSGTH
jgi:hypothetical protein